MPTVYHFVRLLDIDRHKASVLCAEGRLVVDSDRCRQITSSDLVGERNIDDMTFTFYDHPDIALSLKKPVWAVFAFRALSDGRFLRFEKTLSKYGCRTRDLS